MSRTWVTALHHSSVLEPDDVLLLLRSGADVNSRRYGMINAPSPVDIALQLPCAAAQLVVEASRPWSPATHHLFPIAARQRAAQLVRLGYLIALRNVFHLDAPGSLLDAWLLVIQFLVRRK